MNQGTLSGKAIESAISKGTIEIDPFDIANLNPNSYDLRLGTGVRVYRNWIHDCHNDAPKHVIDGSRLYPHTANVSIKDNLDTVHFEMNQDAGWLLKPGIGYLMHTAERVHTDSFVPIIDGKSSIGRLFIQIHQTAGYGDTGFNGQFTLEVTSVHPIRIYPGMRIAQVRFHTIVGEITLYTGKYRDEAAKGAVGSRTTELL